MNVIVNIREDITVANMSVWVPTFSPHTFIVHMRWFVKTRRDKASILSLTIILYFTHDKNVLLPIIWKFYCVSLNLLRILGRWRNFGSFRVLLSRMYVAWVSKKLFRDNSHINTEFLSIFDCILISFRKK